MSIKEIAISGESVANVAKRAIQTAKSMHMNVILVHNTIEITVYPESFLYDILDKYVLTRDLKR